MENAYRIQKRRVASWLYWQGPVVLWMAVIFFLSGRHSVTVSPEYLWNFLFFKTLHLIEYAVLFALCARTFFRSGSGMAKDASYRAAFGITMVYAITDEFHQQFVPSREGRPRDVIIDGIGAGLIWYYLLKLLPKAPPKLRSLVKNLGVPF